ncbi:MAG TPA: polysaccharide deacetylase family protein [Rhodothermales bacterium]|nr:polysaccharide deacetylase family protein [Rhodothermales bacterium]
MIDVVHTVGTRLPRWVARYYPDVLWRIPTTERVVYFTFDDGPTVALTAALLDILARFDASATFFLLGKHAQQHPALVRDLADAGHTLGNHTFSHPDAWRASSARVLSELERTTGLLEDLTGQPLRWMRPPYGRFTQAIRRWCDLRRQRCTMWDIGPGDYLPTATTHRISRRILDAVRPGSIIVLHDNPKARHVTPAALTSALQILHDEGWQFAGL